MTPRGIDPPLRSSAPSPEPIIIRDRLERRIRKPADLLRLAAGCVTLALLVGAGLAARATARGAETDITAAGHHLPGVLLALLRIVSGFALLALPAALAVRQLARGHYRRLSEAIATSAVTVAVVVAANALLHLPGTTDLYAALTVTRSGQVHTAPLDAYLAAFAAYVTVIDLAGRPRWRAAVWLAVGAYVITSLVAVHATALSLALTLVLGRVPWIMGPDLVARSGLTPGRWCPGT